MRRNGQIFACWVLLLVALAGSGCRRQVGVAARLPGGDFDFAVVALILGEDEADYPVLAHTGLLAVDLPAAALEAPVDGEAPLRLVAFLYRAAPLAAALGVAATDLPGAVTVVGADPGGIPLPPRDTDGDRVSERFTVADAVDPELPGVAPGSTEEFIAGRVADQLALVVSGTPESGTDAISPGTDALTDSGGGSDGALPVDSGGTDAGIPVVTICPGQIGWASCGDIFMGSNASAGSANAVDSYACSMVAETSNEVAYSFMPTGPRDVVVTLTEQTSNADLFITPGAESCSGASCIDRGGYAGTVPEFAEATVAGGEQVHFVVDAPGGIISNYVMTVSCLMPLVGNGVCGSPYVIIANNPGSYAYKVDTCGFGGNFGAPSMGACSAVGSGPEVVFRLDLANAGMVSVDLVEMDPVNTVDAVLYVLPNCTPSMATEPCSDNVGGEIRHAHLDLALSAGSHFIILDGATINDCGPMRLHVEVL